MDPSIDLCSLDTLICLVMEACTASRRALSASASSSVTVTVGFTTASCSEETTEDTEFFLRVPLSWADGGGEIISHAGSLALGWYVAFSTASADSSILVGESNTGVDAVMLVVFMGAIGCVKRDESWGLR